jgi:hypothetical protein
MATRQYVGKAPGDPRDITDVGYIQAQIAATNNTEAAIQAQIAAALSAYATKAYVDTKDALNATKAYVDGTGGANPNGGDAGRLHLNQIGANNGVAGLNVTTGKVDVARVPVASTQRWPSPYYSPSAYNTATAVTYDATGHPTTGTGTAETLTWTHPIAGNCVIVATTVASDVQPVVTASVGSTAMILLGGIPIGNYKGLGTYWGLVLFGLLNPPTGTQTISLSVASGTDYIAANSVSYFNVSGFGSIFTNTGTDTTLSLAAPSIAGQMVVNAFTDTEGTLTAYNQTTRSSIAYAASVNEPLLIGDAPGAPSLHFSVNTSGSPTVAVAVILDAIGQASTTETVLYTEAVSDPGYVYKLLVGGLADVFTTVDGTYPIVRVRAGSANGPVIAIGNGSSESYSISPTFDAAGSGFAGTIQNFTFNHTAATGAYVIVDVCTSGATVSTCTYGGTAMTQLGSVVISSFYGSTLTRYGLAGVVGGTKTVSIGLSAVTDVTAGSVSYLNVGTVGGLRTVSGDSSTTPAQTVTCTPGQTIVQSLGGDSASSLWTPTGGTSRYNNGDNVSGTYDADLVISDSTTSPTTFSVSNLGNNWAGISNVLTTSIPGYLQNLSTAVITPVLSQEIPNIAFDALGAGVGNSPTNIDAATVSFTHTAAAGALVIVDINFDSTSVVLSCVYGQTEMTQIGSIYHDNIFTDGSLVRYAIANVSGGTQTISITLSQPAWIIANSVSYLNVYSIGTAQVNYGVGPSLSHTISCTAGQRIVHSFGQGMGAGTGTAGLVPSGGTTRYSRYSSGWASALVISEASATTTFSVAAASGAPLAGLATVLSPETAPGPLSGSTELFVTIAPSGMQAIAQATTFDPALWVMPVPA